MSSMRSEVWCTSCQRWLRCRCGFDVAEVYIPAGAPARFGKATPLKAKTCSCFIHTCYDAQPKLYFGAVGAGAKWHIGNQEKPLALCTLGTFKPLLLAVSEALTEKAALCKNCVRRWRRWREYKDL